MKKNPSNVVATAHHSIGGGRATHKPARERAGGTATSPEDQWTLDTGPWNAVPGATGYKVRVPSGDEGDFDGRSDAERLVEGGVTQAGRDQMLEAIFDLDIND